MMTLLSVVCDGQRRCMNGSRLTFSRRRIRAPGDQHLSKAAKLLPIHRIDAQNVCVHTARDDGTRVDCDEMD
jgi:hypothetical protein